MIDLPSNTLEIVKIINIYSEHLVLTAGFFELNSSIILGRNFYEITFATIIEMHSWTYSAITLFAILMHFNKLSFDINLSAICSNLS